MRVFACLCLVLLLSSCKEKYEVMLEPTQTAFLVVEGFINIAGATEIKLSRTTPLGDRGTLFEEDAVVAIEADNGNVYPLSETDSGRYVSEGLQLGLGSNYRLEIRTADGNRYYSSFEKPIITPELELTWERYNEGVEIYVNTQDNVNDTKYYRWEYDEDWEIHSDYTSTMTVYETKTASGALDLHFGFRDSLTFSYNDSLYYCWRSKSSTAIKVGSTERLAEARVYSPIVYYQQGAEEMSVLYSVIVKQYGLSKEGYEFFSKIKKNTESLGTIFDAQPSEIRGNIRNADDAEEVIIGYIPVSSVTEKRLFIRNNELANWNYNSGCAPQFFYVRQDRESILDYIYTQNMIPTDGVFDASGVLMGASVAKNICVDCRLRGSNNKPAFWP